MNIAPLSMPGPEPTHGDILYKIGELKGQVDTLIVLVGQKREDLNAAFTRLGAIEKTAASNVDLKELAGKISGVQNTTATWGGFALAFTFIMPLVINAATFIMPLVINAAQPYLHPGGKPVNATTHKEQVK